MAHKHDKLFFRLKFEWFVPRSKSYPTNYETQKSINLPSLCPEILGPVNWGLQLGPLNPLKPPTISPVQFLRFSFQRFVHLSLRDREWLKNLKGTKHNSRARSTLMYRLGFRSKPPNYWKSSQNFILSQFTRFITIQSDSSISTA